MEEKKRETRVIMLAGLSVRVGTNYFGSIFFQHPDVDSLPNTMSIGEFPFFRPNVLQGLNQFMNQFNRGFFVTPRLQTESFKTVFANEFLEEAKKQYELTKDTIFLKDPNIINLEQFPAFFPGGSLVFLVRDGRDYVCSYVKSSIRFRRSHSSKKRIKRLLSYYTGRTFIQACNVYNKRTKSLIEVISKLDKSTFNDYRIVRYEDVLDNKERIKELLLDLKLRVTEDILQDMLNAPVMGSSFSGNDKNLNWKGQAKTKDFKSVGRWNSWGWLKKLTFYNICRVSMNHWGYK